jgi:hypothetical protein
VTLTVLFVALAGMMLVTSAVSDDQVTAQTSSMGLPENALMINNIQRVMTVDSYLLAMNRNGLTVCTFDPQTEQFTPGPFLFMSARPIRAELSVDSAYIVVQTNDNVLHLFETDHLPDLVEVISLKIPVSFADFALDADVLFLARWFDGIEQYEVDFQQGTVTLTGSSLYPILSTQVEAYSDTVYLQDEYNGVMRWPAAQALSEQPQELLLPRRARSFGQLSDRFYFPLVGGEEKVLVGEFGHQGAGVVDTVSQVTSVERIFFTDSLIVMASPVEISVVRRDQAGVPGEPVFSRLFRGLSTTGDVYAAPNNDYLVLPVEDEGLTLFDLNDNAAHHPALKQTGQINAVSVSDGRIVASTSEGRINVFNVDSLDQGSPSFSLGSLFDQLQTVARNGDTLLVVHSWPPVLSLVHKVANPDDHVIEGNSSLVDMDVVRRVRYLPGTVSQSPGVIVCSHNRAGIYSLDAEGQAIQHDFVSFGETITACDASGDLLMIGTDHSRLYLYRISDDMQLEEVAVGNAPAAVTAIAMRRSLGYAFAGNSLLMIDLLQPSARLIDSVKHPVAQAYDALLDNNRLYAAGPEGISVYELGYFAPQLVDQGGVASHMVAVEDDYLISSDGSAVYVHRLPKYLNEAPDPEALPVLFTLSQNYPNPFNATTTIEFTITHRASVELVVYNMLGQEVTRLVDGPVARGPHEVVWEGTNADGQSVASGVYFYQLRVNDSIEARKMILLK